MTSKKVPISPLVELVVYCLFLLHSYMRNFKTPLRLVISSEANHQLMDTCFETLKHYVFVPVPYQDTI